MVSKFKTAGNSAVAFLICLGLAGFSGGASARGENDNQNTNSDIRSADDIFKLCLETDGPKGSDAYKKCVKRQSETNTLSGCDADYKAWKDALSSFQGACSKSQIKTIGKNSKLNEISPCLAAIDYCECATYEPDSDAMPSKCSDIDVPETPETEATRTGSEDSSTSSTSTTPMIDLRQQQMGLSYCPSMNNTDYKDFKKEVEDTQKDVDDLEDKIPELQKQLDDVQKNLGDTLAGYEEEKVAAQKEYRDGLKAIKRDMKGAIKHLTDQITQVQEKIYDFESQIREFEIGKVQARLTRDDAVATISVDCYRQVTKAVSDRREALIDQIQKGQINRGNFGAALSNVGLSDRKADQRLADKLYTECKNSKLAKDAVKRADEALAVSLSRIDDGMNKLRLAVKQAKDSIEQIRSNGGCGPESADPTGENTSQMCKAVQNAQEDMADLNKEASANAAKLTNKINKANKDAAAEHATRTKALTDAQNRLDRDRTYLEEKRVLLGMKMKIGGGGSAKAEDVLDVFGKGGTLHSAATDLAQKCCADNSSDQRADCRKVRTYLEGLGEDWPAPTDTPALQTVPTPKATTVSKPSTGRAHMSTIPPRDHQQGRMIITPAPAKKSKGISEGKHLDDK